MLMEKKGAHGTNGSPEIHLEVVLDEEEHYIEAKNSEGNVLVPRIYGDTPNNRPYWSVAVTKDSPVTFAAQKGWGKEAHKVTIVYSSDEIRQAMPPEVFKEPIGTKPKTS